MHSSNNRLNTNFQILYFLVGSCHTTDGAYFILKDLREDRSNALKMTKTTLLKNKAKKLSASRALNSPDEVEILLAEADLAELEAVEDTFNNTVKAASEELEFIEECIRRIEPHRKYSHVPDSEASEISQREEWRLELINRAENCLITSGTIPIDEFNTMRMHPDFKSSILPEITNIKQCIEDGRVQDRLFPENVTQIRQLIESEEIKNLLENKTLPLIE